MGVDDREILNHNQSNFQDIHELCTVVERHQQQIPARESVVNHYMKTVNAELSQLSNKN
jgi:hypothetical protein